MPNTNEYMRKYRAANPDKVRAANLWRNYRIRLHEYEAMREAQGYRCAICRRHEDEIPAGKMGRPRADGTPSTPAMKLLVDHCHKGKGVRKLLCNPCNVMIGMSREDPEVLDAGAAYVRRYLGELTVEPATNLSPAPYPDDF